MKIIQDISFHYRMVNDLVGSSLLLNLDIQVNLCYKQSAGATNYASAEGEKSINTNPNRMSILYGIR